MRINVNRPLGLDADYGNKFRLRMLSKFEVERGGKGTSNNIDKDKIQGFFAALRMTIVFFCICETALDDKRFLYSICEAALEDKRFF